MKAVAQITVLILAVVLVAGGAYAQFDKPEDAIQYRKSVMVLIVTHFKRMGAVAQGKADYDKQAFAADADVVKLMATLPWEASLTPGSDKGDTTQSAAVFSKKDEFLKTAATFEAETAKLAAASTDGDFEAIKAQFGVVAQSCKACHNAFRK